MLWKWANVNLINANCKTRLIIWFTRFLKDTQAPDSNITDFFLIFLFPASKKERWLILAGPDRSLGGNLKGSFGRRTVENRLIASHEGEKSVLPSKFNDVTGQIGEIVSTSLLSRS